jgi:hypothetical protein
MDTQPQEPVGLAEDGTSLAAHLINVLAVPGDVFGEVAKAAPRVAHWLVPVWLASLVGMIAVFVMFSQPAILQQVREAREIAMQKQVQAGKLTRQQADMAAQTTERFLTPTVLKIFGSGGAVVGSFGYLFVVALYVWLVGAKAFKADFPFPRALEVCGLSLMVGVVGGLVQVCLVLLKGNLYVSAGPALFITNFDPANKTHLLLAALNVFTLWQMAVLAVGLARTTGARWLRALVWLLVPWALLKAGLILSGLGGGGL